MICPDPGKTQYSIFRYIVDIKYIIYSKPVSVTLNLNLDEAIATGLLPRRDGNHCRPVRCSKPAIHSRRQPQSTRSQACLPDWKQGSSPCISWIIRISSRSAFPPIRLSRLLALPLGCCGFILPSTAMLSIALVILIPSYQKREK